MQDLTTGPITRHLLKTTSFMLVAMVFQTLYFLIDLYWVGRLGTSAVAAVAIAGNVTFIVLALSQMLGIGTTTVISHAFGSGNREQAKLLFNQSHTLAVVIGAIVLAAGLALRGPYSRAMSADVETARLASDFLLWFMIAMALQFLMAAMGSALRGIGNFKTGMVVATATIIINIVMSPVLMFGWFTGRPFGVAGAALGTLIGTIVGVAWLAVYFMKPGALLRFDRAESGPRIGLWKRMLAIGAPVGFEFALMAVYMTIVYAITRPFGAEAQAGFGVSARIGQAMFMPVVALGMSVAPVAGQNFGARKADRVRATFRDAAYMASVWMGLWMIVAIVLPEMLIDPFTRDDEVVRIGAEYLRIISIGFVPTGLVFVASSMFQAMGNTVPSLVSSAARIAIVAVPGIMLSRMAGFELAWLWFLSVSATFVQLVLALALLRREFGRRLRFVG